MRLLIGVAWLWAFLGLGSATAAALGLPLPGSVVGMVLLWVALETGAVRLAWLDGAAGSLLALLGLLFVPAGVGFLQYAGAGPLWLAVGAAVTLGALATLTVTGHVVQRAVGRD